MPRLVNTEERDTVDLHAPWWSDNKDENGRYLERCVVYRQMTEGDEQWISEQNFGRIKVQGSGKKAMQEAMSSLRGMAAQRTYLLLRMVRELTDEHGVALPLSKATIERLEKADTTFIGDEMDELYERDVAPVLERDIAQAEFNALPRDEGGKGLTDEEKTDPVLVAQANFRRRR